MKPKTLILMLVAVGCGLVAAYLASQVGTQGSQSNQKGVVVALVEIPAGTMINSPEKQLRIQAFNLDGAPADGFSNPEDLRNKTIGRNIGKGDPITARDFSEHGALFRPAPPGYRAVTIRVTLESGLAGFALPGARVDLICTRQNPANQSQTVADTFMENVLVLAVNTLRTGDTSQESKVGVVAAPSVVTLAAKPVDAARIIWAKEKGHITLTLRRPGEDEDAKVPQVTELGTTGIGGGPGAKGSQMVKVWVARDNVWPGQIDKPEQVFTLDDVPPTMALEALKGPNPPPVGRLYSLVAKGMPVTPFHYKPGMGGSDTTPAPTRGGIIVMTIREAGKDPKYFKFTQDGQPLDDGKPSADGPGAAPGGGTEGAGEIK